MSFSLTNLSSWSDIGGEFTAKAILTNHLASIPGIHEMPIPSAASSVEVPYLYSTPVFRNAQCGWTSSGVTNMGSKNVSIAGVEFLESLCSLSLKSKVSAYFMKNNSLDGFENEIRDEKLKQIARASQNLAMNGNAVAGTTYLAITNGLLYKLDNTYSASTVNISKSALTNSSTVISYMDVILAGIPDEIRDMENLAVMIAPSSFATLQVALRNANYYNYNTTGADSYSFKMPGYNNVTIYSVPDMATNRAIVTYPQNIIHLVGVSEPLDVWYSKDNKEYRMTAGWEEAWDFHFEGLVVRM